MCGIFCESDVMFRNHGSGSLHKLRVSDLMTTPVITSSGTAKLTRCVGTRVAWASPLVVLVVTNAVDVG